MLSSIGVTNLVNMQIDAGESRVKAHAKAPSASFHALLPKLFY